MILVVGATGQLGTAVIRRLQAAGERVRGFVRPSTNAGQLGGERVELALGDLRDAPSVEAACAGVDVIIATANTVVPRGRYSFAADEGQGYRNLLAAAKRHGVAQFIFMSVPVTPHDDVVPTFRFKRIIERLLIDSGIPYTIFRGSAFIDDWFAMLGSSIPLRGAEAATLRRPFWFARAFTRGTGHLIEQRGVALVPGSGGSRHAFVALDDVAFFLAKASRRADVANAVLELGGPEVLSWDAVVALFGKVLGRDIRAVHVPAGAFRFAQRLLSPFSPAAANLMGLSWTLATVDTPYDMTRLAPKFGIELTSGEAFLRAKLALPDSG